MASFVSAAAAGVGVDATMWIGVDKSVTLTMKVDPAPCAMETDIGLTRVGETQKKNWDGGGTEAREILLPDPRLTFYTVLATLDDRLTTDKEIYL